MKNIYLLTYFQQESYWENVGLNTPIKKRCIPQGPLSYRLARLRGCYASEIELLLLVFRVLLDWPPCGIIVSLRNRMAGRRGRQNACAWQKWQDYYVRVLSWYIHITLTFTSLYKKIPFKGEWSLAKSCFKQNYCHACYTRFAVFFPLPSGCVNKFTQSECLRNSSLLFTLTFSLSSAVTSRQVLVSAFIEKLFSRTVVLYANSFTKSFFSFPNRTVIREIHEMLIRIY